MPAELLPPTCPSALKEWAVICEALGQGVQTILFRKGGIQEESSEFRVVHPQFWLYPTAHHQGPDSLLANGREVWTQVQANPPRPHQIVVKWLGAVDAAIRLTRLEEVLALCDQQILSPETLQTRFHYREPGLWMLLIRVWARPEPLVLEERPEYQGCRSWVSLSESFSTEGLQPVLSDSQFGVRRAAIANALAKVSSPLAIQLEPPPV